MSGAIVFIVLAYTALMLAARHLRYIKEWRHFTLGNEPFRGTYFDFPVR